MENFEKILELLEKKSLSEQEQKMLREFTASDAELTSFLEMYNRLNKTISSSGHLSTDLISSYILVENGDELDSRLISALRSKIISHINECKLCRDEYNELFKEYKSTEDYVDKSIKRDIKSAASVNAILTASFFRKNSSLRYVFTTLSILIIAYIGIFVASSVLTPDYKKNIFIDDQDNFYKTRGRTSDLFQRGLSSIDEGDYSTAIEFLTKDIAEHRNEKSIFYSHYILGITYLKSAEKDFIGLFKSYDGEDVNLAIKSFKESIDLNNSGNYESLKLDSYFYIGRAYSLIDNQESATQNLQKVIYGKGRFSKEASALIQQLEKN